MAKDTEKSKKTKRPTAEKRLLQNKKQRMRNKAFKSSVRSAIRNFETAVSAGDQEKMTSSLSEVYSLVDKCVKKGIYKLNKASRTKSRLAAKAVK